MLLFFATKRGANGLRKTLLIDTDAKQFSREPRHWYGREDLVEVNLGDFRRLQEQAEKAGFTRVEYLG